MMKGTYEFILVTDGFLRYPRCVGFPKVVLTLRTPLIQVSDPKLVGLL